MRKLLSSTLTLLLLAAAAYADDAQNAAKGGDDEIRSAFSKLDVETRIRLMKKFDKDGDGRLSPEERKEAMEAMKGKAADLESLRQKHVEDVMNRFDKDGDGKLDKSELAASSKNSARCSTNPAAPEWARRANSSPRRKSSPSTTKTATGKIDAEERRAMFKDAANAAKSSSKNTTKTATAFWTTPNARR